MGREAVLASRNILQNFFPDCSSGSPALTGTRTSYFSSPVEIYESIPCVGMKIEDTPVHQITQCKMALTNYTFISVPEVAMSARLVQTAGGRGNYISALLACICPCSYYPIRPAD